MVFIVYYSDRKALRKYKNLRWAHIGSYNGLEQTKNILLEEKRRFIGPDIEQITQDIRGNFIDYIGLLSQHQRNKVIWYASRMASKSVTQTNFFQQYIYQKLIEKLSQAFKDDILIVSDDYEFIKNTSNIRPEGIVVSRIPLFDKKKVWNKILKYPKLTRYLLLWLSLKLFKNKDINKFDVFIHSWVSEKVFSRLPNYADSNLGGLENFLKGKGYVLGRLVPLVLPLQYVFRLKRNFSNIVFPMSYLKFSDCLRAVFTKFSIAYGREDDFRTLKDLNTLRILSANEVSREKDYLYFLNYLMSFYAYKNLGKKIKSSASFIYPFENQPWEKVLNLALARFKRIAYQHSTIGNNWLDHCFSQHEIKHTPLPDTILTAGRAWSNLLRQYYKHSLIKEAGAVRYAYFFKKKIENNFYQDRKNIVVALPISPNISAIMQKCILSGLVKSILDGYTVKIKPHPYLPAAVLLKKEFSKFKNCSFVDTAMNDLLNDCCLLVTSSSTVVFESVFSKVKTLYLMPEEFSLGHEYLIRSHLFIAYEQDFSQRLEEALHSTRYPDLNIEEYFSESNFKIFLEHIENKRDNL